MKQRVKEPYYAFNPKEAHFLFERTIRFESRAELLAKISRIIHRMYFPKKAIITFFAVIIAFILAIIVTYLINLFSPSLANKIGKYLALIPLIDIGILVYLVNHYFNIYLEIRSVKKLYKKNVEWPVECYCAYFQEGIYIKSIDMEGIFYWDDFMAMGCSKDALVFHFCPARTPSGKFFKQYYPRLDNVYIFIDGDEQVRSLIAAVNEHYKGLVAFK